MKILKNGTIYEFVIEGSLGEGSPLFEQKLADATQINLDVEKLSYINSVGVKTWIYWVTQLPPKAPFVLKKAPLLIVNQASMVMGFLPPQGQIESFFAPFICPKCDTDATHLLTQGKDYERSASGKPAVINLPKVLCPKCQTEMEHDFTIAKSLTFLGELPPQKTS
jgi:hypothetical protein